MDKEKEKQGAIEAVLEDSIRFGAAIGSWLDCDGFVRWHQRGGAGCVKAIKEAAALEIKSKLREIENNLCHGCGRQKENHESPKLNP